MPVKTQSSGRNQEMKMRVVMKVLSPSMQYRHGTCGRAQIFLVSAKRFQARPGDLEQRLIPGPFIVPQQLVQRWRNGKNQVKMRDRKQLFLPVTQPFFGGQ